MLENLFQAILIALVNISESEESKAQGHEAEDSRERSELYDVDDHEMTQTQGQDDRGGEAEATALGREAREQKDGPKNCPEGGGIVLSGIPGELSPEEERDKEEAGSRYCRSSRRCLVLTNRRWATTQAAASI